MVKQIGKAGLQLTQRGFGPWARVYREPEGSRRRCVQLCILPWNALDTREWGRKDDPQLLLTMHPTDLAQYLGLYAARVMAPRGTTRPVKRAESFVWTDRSATPASTSRRHPRRHRRPRQATHRPQSRSGDQSSYSSGSLLRGDPHLIHDTPVWSGRATPPISSAVRGAVAQEPTNLAVVNRAHYLCSAYGSCVGQGPLPVRAVPRQRSLGACVLRAERCPAAERLLPGGASMEPVRYWSAIRSPSAAPR